MPDLNLQKIVIEWRQLGHSKQFVEQRIGPFSQYPDDDLDTLWANTADLTQKVRVEHSYRAQAGIAANYNVNVNATLPMSTDLEESNWVIDNGTITYTGSPDFVEILGVIPFQVHPSVNAQRAAPALDIFEGATSDLVTSIRTGYMRDSSAHDQSSWTIAHSDNSPGLNPAYRFVTRRESVVTGTCQAVASHITLKAVFRQDLKIRGSV